jgi:hypothetical protein
MPTLKNPPPARPRAVKDPFAARLGATYDPWPGGAFPGSPLVVRKKEGERGPLWNGSPLYTILDERTGEVLWQGRDHDLLCSMRLRLRLHEIVTHLNERLGRERAAARWDNDGTPDSCYVYNGARVRHGKGIVVSFHGRAFHFTTVPTYSGALYWCYIPNITCGHVYHFLAAPWDDAPTVTAAIIETHIRHVLKNS